MKNKLIIVPVYNEEKYIKQVIRNIKRNIDTRCTDILIVNDRSTDKTAQYLDKMKNITVLTHQKNCGYGCTLIDGFNYAVSKKYKYVVTMDCDRQHEPYRIATFFHEIEKDDFDIISGSRYLKRIKYWFIPRDRMKINRKITAKINQITGYHLTDSFCGFKAYKISALKKLKLTEPGYGMPLQLWILAGKNKLNIKEISVKLIYLDYTRNFKNNFMSVFTRYKYYLGIIEREGD